MFQAESNKQVFIGFAAEDRYDIVESLVYHLKNYGINVWYDRHMLVMSDNRVEKNLVEGIMKSDYAIVILSKHTEGSLCALEEISLIESRYNQGLIAVFPILYEISPDDLPKKLRWIKSLIFKEVNRCSGTREVCNHIACKITSDFLSGCRYQNIDEVISARTEELPFICKAILNSYRAVDYANLNSRVSLLYAAYLTVIHTQSNVEWVPILITRIFERLFTETRLFLAVDYREVWLLENAICLLISNYPTACTELRI